MLLLTVKRASGLQLVPITLHDYGSLQAEQQCDKSVYLFLIPTASDPMTDSYSGTPQYSAHHKACVCVALNDSSS